MLMRESLVAKSDLSTSAGSTALQNKKFPSYCGKTENRLNCSGEVPEGWEGWI